jgi:hypothetical protein
MDFLALDETSYVIFCPQNFAFTHDHREWKEFPNPVYFCRGDVGEFIFVDPQGLHLLSKNEICIPDEMFNSSEPYHCCLLSWNQSEKPERGPIPRSLVIATSGQLSSWSYPTLAKEQTVNVDFKTLAILEGGGEGRFILYQLDRGTGNLSLGGYKIQGEATRNQEEGARGEEKEASGAYFSEEWRYDGSPLICDLKVGCGILVRTLFSVSFQLVPFNPLRCIVLFHPPEISFLSLAGWGDRNG